MTRRFAQRPTSNPATIEQIKADFFRYVSVPGAYTYEEEGKKYTSTEWRFRKKEHWDKEEITGSNPLIAEHPCVLMTISRFVDRLLSLYEDLREQEPQPNPNYEFREEFRYNEKVAGEAALAFMELDNIDRQLDFRITR